MRTSASRLSVGLFVVLSTAGVAAALGPRYVEVDSATRGHPLGVLVVAALFVGLALIVLVPLLLGGGTAFVFAVIDAWLLLILVPTVFIGAINVWLDDQLPTRTPLKVVDKEFHGRYGKVANAEAARHFILNLGGWASEPTVRQVPVTRPMFNRVSEGDTIMLCVHPGRLGRAWIEAPITHAASACQ